MKAEELKKVLELHKMWLNKEEGGKPANLIDADIRGVYLSGVDLSGAYLSGAIFSGAIFSRLK